MRQTELQLAEDAVAAYAAAVEAVQPEAVLGRAVERRGHALLVAGAPLPTPAGRTLVAALGKAAPGLAAAWLELAAGHADEVIVLTPHGVPLPANLGGRVRVLRGAHPVPDDEGERSCRELLARVRRLGPDDLLVVLLSGGASALLAAPHDGLDLEDVRATTSALLAAGAPIGELNTVRRQLLAAAGGGLARAAAPAAVTTLVLSDVLGNPLPDIASGPTVPSPDGPADALAVLERRDARLPNVAAFLADRTRPPAPSPGRVIVVGDLASALDGAAAALTDRGWRVLLQHTRLTGEARARGRQLGALLRSVRPAAPTALVLGGEPTVTVRGPGRGGRAQELALAAALELAGTSGRVLLAAGTDGIDGPTSNAGALVDGATVERLRAVGFDPAAALAANDSATALEAIGAVLTPGPTGTNVGDLILLLAEG